MDWHVALVVSFKPDTEPRLARSVCANNNDAGWMLYFDRLITCAVKGT
jgi:hypothetical protein